MTRKSEETEPFTAYTAEFFASYAERKTTEIVQKAVELRKENYLSQAQVSELLGLKSHGNITLVEQGKTIPGLDRILRILAIYGYTLEVVPLKGTEERKVR